MVLDGAGGSIHVLSVDNDSSICAYLSDFTLAVILGGVVGCRDVHSILALVIWLREGLILEPRLREHHDTLPTFNHSDS